jgi:hypothetical protein
MRERASDVMLYRIAARSKLLLTVCMTHTFAYASTKETAVVFSCAKSIDVGLVYDEDAVKIFIVQQRFSGFKGDERPGWVAGRTEEYRLDGWVNPKILSQKFKKSRVLGSLHQHEFWPGNVAKGWVWVSV